MSSNSQLSDNSREKLIFCHPTGNANARAVLRGICEAGILAEFHTSVAVFEGTLLSLLMQTPPGRGLQRRMYSQMLQTFTYQRPSRELCRLFANKIGFKALTRHETGRFCVDAIYRHLDKSVSRRLHHSNCSGVYAYEDGALQTFRSAKELGIKCIYDLPIAYWRTSRKLLLEQSERFPEWKHTLLGTRDSPEKLQRKDEELQLADVVLCPSTFVRDSLPQEIVKNTPVHMVPFGSPEVQRFAFDSVSEGHNVQSATAAGDMATQNKLKVFFAGSMTQRKGLADLFNAMKLLDPQKFELHVLGSSVAPMEFYRRQYPDFIHHATRSHEDVLKLMREMDIFVLPSVVEGRALVQQEALACGLPIIVTKNAGAEDLVADGKAGFLVDVGDSNEIARCLKLVGDDHELLDQMSDNAFQKAMEVTWTSYQEQVVKVVTEAIGK